MDWDLDEALAYYARQGAPRDQNAMVQFLKEAQSANPGGIPRRVPARAAEAWNVKEGVLLTLIRRIPSLRLSERHVLEICAGPSCAKHTALAAQAEALAGEKLTVKFVPCMRQCAQGPNIRWDGTLYTGADERLLNKLAGDI